MAYDVDVRGLTLPAAADLSSKLFYLGIVNASGQVAVQTSAGGPVDGVIYSDTPGAGLPVEFITTAAAVKVAAGAAVTVGDTLECDATGRVITWASGDKIGKALASASGAGVIIPIIPHFMS